MIAKSINERKETLKESRPFRSALNSRLFFGLLAYFGGSLPDPQDIANEGARRLSLADGVGPVSLQLLAKVLHEYGYIDDPGQWLAGK